MNYFIHSVLFSIICATCWKTEALPNSINPNLDYELVNVNKLATVSTMKPDIWIQHETTPKQIVFKTSPPIDPKSKTFAYNPQAKTWSLIKKNDPQPSEETLLWNQSNDKWLTQIAR